MKLSTAAPEPEGHTLYQARVHWLAFVTGTIGSAISMVLTMTPGRLFGLLGTQLRLTEQRVSGSVGTFRPKYLSLAYPQVASVIVQQSPLGLLFDYGTVIITGNDGSKVKFRGIAEPYDVKMQIDEAVEMAVLGRKLSQVVMD